jgi:hypothetical protein
VGCSILSRFSPGCGRRNGICQTKGLDCECAFYEISAEGRLLRWPDDADELNETGFDGCITVCARQCYHLYFNQGQLEWIEGYSGDRWPFEPGRFMPDQA